MVKIGNQRKDYFVLKFIWENLAASKAAFDYANYDIRQIELFSLAAQV